MNNDPAPVTQSTTQVLSPEQRDLLGLAMPGLKSWAANPPKAFAGSTVPGFDPLQTQGQNEVLGQAGAQAGVVGGAASGNQMLTNPNILDPNSNPALKATIDASVRPIYDNLTTRALPAVRSGAQQAGQFGGSRQAIVEGNAIKDANVAAGDTAAKVATQGYQSGLDTMTKNIALSGQAAQGLTIPGLTTSGVGDVRQNLMRELLGENATKWNYEQMLPLLMGKELAGIASGIPGGTTTTTASGPQKNPLMQGLGGAAAGASLGSMIMPGIGTAAGAGLGALLPFLH